MQIKQHQQRYKNYSSKSAGYSLMELMIAVTIVGILASIAVPSYNSSIQKSRRADAASALIGLASALERNYSLFTTYTGTNVSTGSDSYGMIPVSTFYPSESPLSGNDKFYKLRMTVTATTYTVFAIPEGPETGHGWLKLTSTGERGWDKDLDGSYSEDW